MAAQIQKEPIHVDDWAVNQMRFGRDPAARYAAVFFHMYRYEPMMRHSLEETLPGLKDMKLFCTYKGERWRVVGASRLGDIWLSKDFDKDHGYQVRPNVEDCSNWGKEP